ncbi:hypothetical protein F53441_13311 [Fusarium austroafricanum]|uniref:Uncharacterized protein n=1 Tax=Fusarium austroafricanum TaxID=2364996 RepID=A0A8H4JRF8_9HYPO|nr:hypothetical protein F53441_13311 [Fusarium austroafricanum]
MTFSKHLKMQSHDDLFSLITPSLLNEISDGYLPFSQTSELNFSTLRSPETAEHFAKVCESSKAREALIALSHLSPDASLPDIDLMTFLPPPTSSSFPQQCFGLQLLLDQVSRILFKGIDARWQSAYFGPLARRLAGQWIELPEEQKPYKRQRWQDAGISSFSYWVATQIMWAAPFLHAEDLQSQKIGLSLSEALRQAVEAHSNKLDPYRLTRDETLKDDLLFLREVFKGPPLEEGEDSLSITSWTFWWCMILDSHWPIIEKFGRYPYRNAILGRTSTEEEERWLDDTGHVAEAPEDIARRISEDLKKRRWTPLQRN